MKEVAIIKSLTDKEKRFAELAAENFYAPISKTNTQLAIEAGYAKDSARQRAYENFNPKIKPNVVIRIEELKEDFRVRNQITPDKHMARLNELGVKAEKKGNLSVAGRMEELRGRMAGYYIERKLVGHKKALEDLTEEELEDEQIKIVKDWERISSHENKEENDEVE